MSSTTGRNPDNCHACGARPRHQRLVERVCICGEFFDVLSTTSAKRYCSRACQLAEYTRRRGRTTPQ